jgi:hypothetical protein
MSRPPKKLAPEATAPREQHRWAIYRLNAAFIRPLRLRRAPEPDRAGSHFLRFVRIDDTGSCQPHSNGPATYAAGLLLIKATQPANQLRHRTGCERPNATDPHTEDYVHWLGDEPDPADLMRPFRAELMRMWPISTRVNKPENDDPSIVEPIEPAASRGCQ